MAKFNKILFAVDFSANNEKVAPYAKLMAQAHGAALYLLNVVRDLKSYGVYYAPNLDLAEVDAEIARESMNKLQEFGRAHFADLDELHLEVATGFPGREIIDFAKNNGMDLIVMGSHGRTGIDHAIFGSVADKVVKHAEVPVLTVNPKYC